MDEQKSDILPAVALVGSAAALGAGLYLFMKKPAGIDPGDSFLATFNFDYNGQGGPYVLVVRFGYYKPPYFPLGFDEEETLGHHTLGINLITPNHYEYFLESTIPEGAKPGQYDAEFLILTPDMTIGHDYIIRTYLKSVFNVREEED